MNNLRYFILIIFFPITASAQDFVALAKEYQQKYKDDKCVILESEVTYTFSPGTKAPVQVVIAKKDNLLSLRYNSGVYITEGCDGNSSMESFSATSKIKDRTLTGNMACLSYTSDGLFYDDSKVCTRPLPLDEIGDRWNVETVKRISDAKYLTTVYFQDQFPLIKRTIKFIIPSTISVDLREFNLEDFHITRKESTASGTTTVEFQTSTLETQHQEEMSRGNQYTQPHVLVLLKSVKKSQETVNILSTPQDLYAWCTSLTSQLHTKTSVFQGTVNDLIRDKKTDEEKVKAIYYWVQDNIRYIAFEDGLAAFKPSEAHDVYEKRYGDCKGMANLTKEMLKAAGFDARLTWIGTRRIMYDHTLPSLAVNNHMICTLILSGKKYYLDATEKYVPFGENAARIQNRSVMIENGPNYLIDVIAPSVNGTDFDARNLSVAIHGEDLQGRIEINLNGEARKNFLRHYHYTKNEEKDEYISQFISKGNSNIKTSNLSVPNLNERGGKLSLTSDLDYKGAVTTFNNEYYIDIDPAKSFKNFSLKETRQSDVDFGENINYKTSIELAIPAGYTVSSLPDKVEINDPEFSFLVQYAQNANKIIYTKKLTIPDGIIRKKSFTRWNDAIKKLAAGYENQIILKK